MNRVSSNLKLETPRLVLRRLRAADAENVFRMAADSEMWRYPERPAMSSEEAWNLLLRHEGSWTVVGYGVFAVEEKPCGSFVGLAGFSDFRRRIDPEFDGHPEITWSIVPQAQGRGYATEAGEAAIRWLEREIACKRSVCLVHSANAPSLAVARKLGYQQFRSLVYKEDPTFLLRRQPGPIHGPCGAG